MGYKRQDIKTLNDHSLDEVASAIQKSLRRCDEKHSLYWLKEMCVSGFGKYAFRRLRTVMSEDVGIANPGLASEIQPLYDVFLYWYDSKLRDTGLYAFPAVAATLMLARSQKDRQACDAACLFLEVEQEHLPYIELDPLVDAMESIQPDFKGDSEYVIDWFAVLKASSDIELDDAINLSDWAKTLRDSILNCQEPAVLSYIFPKLRSYGANVTKKAEELWMVLRLLAAIDYPFVIGLHAQLHFLHSAWKQQDKSGEQYLFMAQAVMLLCRMPEDIQYEVCAAKAVVWDVVDGIPRLEIPDYALDQHTARGRQMKRGREHFVQEGALINRRIIENYSCPYQQKFLWYKDGGGRAECEQKTSGQGSLFTYNEVPF